MLTIYWYEKCSTCKKAKAWLESNHLEFEVKDLMTETPSAAEFKQWLKESNLSKKRFFNTSGMVYRSLNLKDKIDSLSIDDACDMLSSDGKLVRRPLLIKDGHFFANGFKEDQYKELL